MSKSLTATDTDTRFWLRLIEIDKSAVARPDADHFEIEMKYMEGIPNIEALETELGEYVSDFSQLDVSWHLDYPL